MKEIDIKTLKSSSKFVTRGLKPAKFLNYVPEAQERSRLLFMVEGNIVQTDEKGKCWFVNSYDADFTSTSFHNFDVFVDNRVSAWINIKEKGDWYEVEGIYKTYEEAKNSKSPVYKTIEIEWREDE